MKKRVCPAVQIKASQYFQLDSRAIAKQSFATQSDQWTPGPECSFRSLIVEIAFV